MFNIFHGMFYNKLCINTTNLIILAQLNHAPKILSVYTQILQCCTNGSHPIIRQQKLWRFKMNVYSSLHNVSHHPVQCESVTKHIMQFLAFSPHALLTMSTNRCWKCMRFATYDYLLILYQEKPKSKRHIEGNFPDTTIKLHTSTFSWNNPHACTTSSA
jgi:hypothetical protein